MAQQWRSRGATWRSSGALLVQPWWGSGAAVAEQWHSSSSSAADGFGLAVAVQTPVLGRRVRCGIEKDKRAAMKGLRDLGFEICREGQKGR
ncbi:hypothetical protein SLEP1_g14837 [Rubroshorea leprosula]|uniref:Uncharacterized protein n=1 Tax=Rubroshorea leprosula TaxID=152421 RepID=A0AAV5IUB6_9ROSI|nr:hypothetical protein SLEP1_g14837 [Rubroshorea leprosula]